VVGQLAEYVRELAAQLSKNKVDVSVVTYHDYLTGSFEDADGVKTQRVTNPVKTHIGVLTWVLTLNQEIERVSANIYYEAAKHVDLIDAYDWHFIPAAATLKKALNIPFIYSVESIEEHRAHGAISPFNMAIKSIEWLGMYEAERLLVKSDWMRDEIIRTYNVPSEKIQVISPKSAQWIKGILEIYAGVSGGTVTT
jgi:1,4-alpha-glucan branching enzyme